MSEVRRISEPCFAVFLLAGRLAVFEVHVETSSPGRAGARPTEKRVDFKRHREGRSLSHRGIGPCTALQRSKPASAVFLL